MDALTGLREREDVAASLTDAPWTAAIFLDVDAFRVANAERGHVAGDETLVAIAARLREVSADAFRVGGDKFLLLHHDATLDDAATLARSLVDNNSFGITFSAVVFALHRDMTSDFASLLDTLTGALYLAEVARGRAERNVVVLA